MNKWIILAFMVVGLLGFLDASYLTALHYLEEIPPCSITQGCEEVTTSKYSQVAGIPVALAGVAYYLAIFLLSVYCFDRKSKFASKALFVLPAAGLMASAWFVYVQLHILNAICIYCMFSAGVSATLFVLSLMHYRHLKTD